MGEGVGGMLGLGHASSWGRGLEGVNVAINNRTITWGHACVMQCNDMWCTSVCVHGKKKRFIFKYIFILVFA